MGEVMLFSPDMLTAVLEGRKTQTRRPVKDGETLVNRWYSISKPYVRAVHTATNRKKWMVTDDIAICPGRGKKAVGRIEITGIRHERFIDISESDARAEGFADSDAFFAKIKQLYGDAVDLRHPCWVIEFRLVQS
jgi:hypothetical protein